MHMQSRATIKAQQEGRRGACAEGRIVRPDAETGTIEEGVAPAQKNDEVFTPVTSPGQSGTLTGAVEDRNQWLRLEEVIGARSERLDNAVSQVERLVAEAHQEVIKAVAAVAPAPEPSPQQQPGAAARLSLEEADATDSEAPHGEESGPLSMEGAVHGMHAHDPTTSPVPTTIEEVHDQMDQLADVLRAKMLHLSSSERASSCRVLSPVYDDTTADVATRPQLSGQHEALEDETRHTRQVEAGQSLHIGGGDSDYVRQTCPTEGTPPSAAPEPEPEPGQQAVEQAVEQAHNREVRTVRDHLAGAVEPCVRSGRVSALDLHLSESKKEQSALRRPPGDGVATWLASLDRLPAASALRTRGGAGEQHSPLHRRHGGHPVQGAQVQMQPKRAEERPASNSGMGTANTPTQAESSALRQELAEERAARQQAEQRATDSEQKLEAVRAKHEQAMAELQAQADAAAEQHQKELQAQADAAARDAAKAADVAAQRQRVLKSRLQEHEAAQAALQSKYDSLLASHQVALEKQAQDHVEAMAELQAQADAAAEQHQKELQAQADAAASDAA
eukprot:COSAG02_NODE_7762_length_2858_cov_3.820225_1_plen_561_part_01